ncbi:putative coiled-coil domain-containing protein 195 [Synchiropus picturatus]
MFKPQQQLLLQDPPQVFGKPWYWQRGSTSMDSTRSLAQVILEMRSEIQKLEEENRELKGDYGARAGEGSSGGRHRAAGEECLAVNLRRNVSAPALETQYTENAVMTVRRYSISSNLSAVTWSDARPHRGRRADSGWGRLQEEIHHSRVLDTTSRGDGGKVTNRHSLQEIVHKNRSKVKSVTFLLPVDDIYTSRPVLPKHQEEPEVSQLASIAEK